MISVGLTALRSLHEMIPGYALLCVESRQSGEAAGVSISFLIQFERANATESY